MGIVVVNRRFFFPRWGMRAPAGASPARLLSVHVAALAPVADDMDKLSMNTRFFWLLFVERSWQPRGPWDKSRRRTNPAGWSGFTLMPSLLALVEMGRQLSSVSLFSPITRWHLS